MGNSNGKPVVFTDNGKSTPPIPTTILPIGRHHHPALFASTHRPPDRPTARPPPLLDFLLTFVSAVNLNHFRLLRVVGKGAFGKVRIVERKDNGSTYALKYIRKDEGEQPRALSSLLRRPSAPHHNALQC